MFHYLSIHNNAEKDCCCKVKDKRILELTCFPFLAAGKIITNTGGLPDVPAEHKATIYKKIIYVDIKLLRLHVDHEVENSEKGKGKDVHENQVEPGDVHLGVDDGQGDLHLGVDDVDVCFQSMEEEVRIVDDG